MGTITGAEVFNSATGKFEKTSLSFDGGVIVGYKSGEVTDMTGKRIIPGLIDVHTHGRNGIDIMKADRDGISALSLEYAKTGVTTVFPTVMTAPMDRLVAAIGNLRSSERTGARFGGIHIEGPYISASKAGCHDIADIRMPDLDEMTALVTGCGELHAHFTVAPENCPDGLIAGLSKIASVGIGHTAASYSQCVEAVGNGAVSFTHTYNAMTGLAHREPGAVGAALDSGAYAEFICDGLHILPEIIAISYRAVRDRSRFVLITDSVPYAGCADGDYDMNGIPFTMSGGRAVRPDGTIVGSTLNMFDAVKNLSRFAGIPFEQALLCATENPARMMGIYGSRGSLDIGKCADFVVLNGDEIASVWIGGKQIVNY